MTKILDEPKNQVLIVDDSDFNVDALIDALGDDYDLRVAVNGETALKIIGKVVTPDLILLDIMMPGMSGYEVCEALKANDATRGIPIIFLTALTDVGDQEKGFNLGAEDYIMKPFTPQIVKARVDIHLKLKKYRDHLTEMVAKKTEQLAHAQEAIITSMAIMAEFRDPETGAHIQRTKAYVRALAQAVNVKLGKFVPQLDVEILTNAAPLHDIGKVAIPDDILFKSGRLTREEFATMQQHSSDGAEVIRRAESVTGTNLLLQTAREVAESHHEKWDGSGYPNGLSGESIPIAARIMAIADVYDALISKRPYKAAMSHEEATHIILYGDEITKPQHFDPLVLDCFKCINEQFHSIAKTFPD
ncbi:MAG: hypothetical protein B6I36_10370 [Desulfobacteraceae bacterium 4572_35.1]|nr:MAG: hypothetical protein B6I36_10370 [Desulfobacteraceae bacterium 4572_35.1]